MSMIQFEEDDELVLVEFEDTGLQSVSFGSK